MANMRDGRADLRLTRTAARLSGRFDFRVVIRNGSLWYADRKSTSSTWHAGSDTFAFHNTTKPNHRCVNDTTGVGVNSTKAAGASMVTWNCATVNRIARGGAESDTAPDDVPHPRRVRRRRSSGDGRERHPCVRGLTTPTTGTTAGRRVHRPRRRIACGIHAETDGRHAHGRRIPARRQCGRLL